MRKTVLTVILAAFTLGLSTAATAKDQGQMVFAIDLIRHGDRAPINDLPSAPFKWPQGLGQLTAEGMNQEFQLGKEFRKRYIEENHLLPAKYKFETIYVRASDIDRTLMSAECALMGLYPIGDGPKTDAGEPGAPSCYQPIPIHTRPRALEDALIPDSVPGLKETYQKYVYDNAEWKAKQAKEQPNFERWGKLIGKPIKDLQSLSGIGDTIHIRQIHHVPPPAGLTKADEESLMNLSDWVFAESFKPAEVGEKAGMNLLKLIVKYFDDAAKGNSKLKYVLFSAHDSTISALMSAMKAPAKHRPHYSSDVSIALWKEGNQYSVKAMLNGEPINFPGATDGTSALAKFDELPNVK